MLQILDGVEKPVDLFLTHHDGKLLRLAADRDDLVDAPLRLSVTL